MSLLGLEKFKEDGVAGFLKDLGGHAGLGFLAALPLTFTDVPAWAFPAVGGAVGTGHEVRQVLDDDTPQPNLLDRLVDVLGYAAGASVALGLRAVLP